LAPPLEHSSRVGATADTTLCPTIKVLVAS
jgi:hypothetical protein